MPGGAGLKAQGSGNVFRPNVFSIPNPVFSNSPSTDRQNVTSEVSLNIAFGAMYLKSQLPVLDLSLFMVSIKSSSELCALALLNKNQGRREQRGREAPSH